ncbi:conserved exported hypothetical protein [Nostocoides australiense Ben110]|uniref:Uncharacterized protein n=1 Tax=Nostocoides australiense Ben110 TaxID=1193182 RepID=W6K3R5_9MICO|nr:hypothetical protein [Tetrasphaera australiensis]CCH73724.1 conserved exported hypothetical protein [Tetrasphaera australiensis Ben110]
MLRVLLPLILCVLISIVVLALVAIPARRQGRDLLTARGEEVFVKVKAGTDAAATKTTGLVTSAAAKIRPTGGEEATPVSEAPHSSTESAPQR